MNTAERKKRTTQRQGVWKMLKDKSWHPLSDFARRVRGLDSGLSARIRELRSKKFGKHVVKCERFPDGTYRYRLVK